MFKRITKTFLFYGLMLGNAALVLLAVFTVISDASAPNIVAFSLLAPAGGLAIWALIHSRRGLSGAPDRRVPRRIPVVSSLSERLPFLTLLWNGAFLLGGVFPLLFRAPSYETLVAAAFGAIACTSFLVVLRPSLLRSTARAQR